MASTDAVAPAKRSSPPPPADLSRATDGEPPFKRRPRDNKFDPSSLPPSTDAAEILKQVEFYFSDANLPRDKFLWNLTAADKQGWVPIATIASFKRMRRFTPLSAIVEALRGSPALLEVNAEGTSVRRRVPLVKPTVETFDEISSRTVHVKGFGDETSTMQVDLEAYFRGFGAVEMVRLRRTATGLFKGSVLVQFHSKDEADKYIAEPRDYEGNLLETNAKQEWVKSKIEENESLDPAEQRERSARKLAELKIKKPFSAFKEMERLELHDRKRDVKRGRDNRRGGGKQGRRGYREDAPRDRSRSPVLRDDTPIKPEAAVAQKRSLEEAEEGKPVKREKVGNGD